MFSRQTDGRMPSRGVTCAKALRHKRKHGVFLELQKEPFGAQGTFIGGGVSGRDCVYYKPFFIHPHMEHTLFWVLEKQGVQKGKFEPGKNFFFQWSRFQNARKQISKSAVTWFGFMDQIIQARGSYAVLLKPHTKKKRLQDYKELAAEIKQNKLEA